MSAVPQQGSRNWGPGLLVAALVAGCVWMAPLWWAGPLGLDEHANYWMASSASYGELLLKDFRQDSMPPFSFAVQKLFLDLFGPSEMVLRVPMVIGYFLAIGAVYQMGRRLYGAPLAGLSALVLACHPDVVDEVRFGRCYGVLLAAAAATYWATICWLTSDKPRWPITLAWCLSTAVMLWTHHLSILSTMLQWGTLFWWGWRASGRRSQAFLHLTIASAGVIVAVLAIAPVVEHSWTWNSQITVGAPAPWHQCISPLLFGLPLLLVAAWNKRSATGGDTAETGTSAWRSPTSFVMVWALLPALAFQVLATGSLSNLATVRYRLPFAIPMSLFPGWILGRKGVGWREVLLTVAMLTVAWTVKGEVPWRLGRLGNSARDAAWREMAWEIGRAGTPAAPVFVQSGGGNNFLIAMSFRDQEFLDYTASRLGTFYLPTPQPRYGLPLIWLQSHDLINTYRELLPPAGSPEAPAVLWLAVATDTDLNRSSTAFFRALLESHGWKLQRQWEYLDAQLLRYHLEGDGMSK